MTEKLNIQKKVDEFTSKFDNNSENWKNQVHIFVEDDGSAVIANCKGMTLVNALLAFISTLLTENKDGEIGSCFKVAISHLADFQKEQEEDVFGLSKTNKSEEYKKQRENLQKVLDKLSPEKVKEMNFSELLKTVAEGMEEENKKSEK